MLTEICPATQPRAGLNGRVVTSDAPHVWDGGARGRCYYCIAEKLPDGTIREWLPIRPDGFYWVLNGGNDRALDQWVVCLWTNRTAGGPGYGWYFPGADELYQDDDWKEIGPRIEAPTPR